MFKSLFGAFKKEEPALADYAGVGVDMHSHLIPGIDDGAKTIEDSMILIRELYGMGFRKFYTTPHIMSDYFRNTPEIILGGLEKVREAISNEGLQIEINAAAEYYIDDGFIKKLEGERLLTIGDNYLLFEISYINCPENIEDIIFRMQVQGYKPIMAHPERYPFWYNNFEQYRTFRDQGVLLQLNLNSLSGYYGHEAKKIGEKLVENNLVDLVGTDCHHMKHIEGLKRGLKEKSLRKLLETNLLNKHL
ncbi:MAG TPA: capsular biosynthesis protein [Bacteroidia bacterium]|nr:capsular biosynthesis protein [Bacteroidia bacterium]